jgi:LPPG:FO 2-phospho-L-lactate transferase
MSTLVALAGGVGGAKLAHGLARLAGEDLAVIVNTADDFEHLGLHICPDVDTVTYTLAGLANPATGWGIRDETWNFLDQVSRLGGPSWFRLGDRDLALHVLRTAALRAGNRLTQITAGVCHELGITARILPMSDAPVRTMVDTADGILPFQEYFVGRRCGVAVRGFSFAGLEAARPTAEVEAALTGSALAAIVMCPSNPYVSLDPILGVPGLRDLVARARAPVVAVSPIIGGAAVKGPAAKMMRELGNEPSALAVAAHFRDLLDGMVIDTADAALAPAIQSLGLAVEVAPTLMRVEDDRLALAEVCRAFARRLAG